MLRDIINETLVTIEPEATVSEAAELMADRNVGSVLVLSEGKPRGIITDRDIVVRCIAENVDVDDCTVEQVMTESLATCQETDGVFECIQKMREAKVRRMPVVDDDGRAVGIVSFGDLLGLLGKEIEQLTATTTPAEDLDLEDQGEAA